MAGSEEVTSWREGKTVGWLWGPERIQYLARRQVDCPDDCICCGNY